MRPGRRRTLAALMLLVALSALPPAWSAWRRREEARRRAAAERAVVEFHIKRLVGTPTERLDAGATGGGGASVKARNPGD